MYRLPPVFICTFLLGFTAYSAITPPSSECEAAADLVFLLDASGSVKSHNFELAKNFIKSVVRGFNIAPEKFQIGLILFATDASIEIPLGSKRTMNALQNAIANISYTGGRTNTGSALKVLREKVFTKEGGDREETSNIAIVMTDGLSTRKKFTKQEAKLARESVVQDIFAVGIGQSVPQEEMLNIVGQPPNGRIFKPKDFDSLIRIRNQLVTGICRVAAEKLVTTTASPGATFPSASQTDMLSTRRPSTAVFTKTTGTRYELVQELKNWNDARWHCINDGGRLAAINDDAAKAQVDDLLKNGAGGTWIAGYKKKQWFFSNGEEISWYNWHLGEPNDLDGHEDVLQIYQNGDPPSYKWNDCSRGTKNIRGVPCFYICQFNDSTICGQLTTEGECILIGNTKYYYFEKDNLYRNAGYNWNEAIERCKERKGILARIRSSSENLIIVQEIKKRREAVYWIDGYWERDMPVSWTWADATSDVTNPLFWSPGQPSNPQDEHCIEVMVTTGHLWNDLDCGQKRNFVCQYEDVSTTTTTPPPRTTTTSVAGHSKAAGATTLTTTTTVRTTSEPVATAKTTTEETTTEKEATTLAASTSPTTRESSSAAATTPDKITPDPTTPDLTTPDPATPDPTTLSKEETATTATDANILSTVTSSKTSHSTMHTQAESTFTTQRVTSKTQATRPIPTQSPKSWPSTLRTQTITSAPAKTMKSSSVTELPSQFTNPKLPLKSTHADFTSTVFKADSTISTCQPCRCTCDRVTQTQSNRGKHSVATGVVTMTTPVATGAHLATRRIFRLFRFPQRRKTNPPMTTEVAYTAPPFVRSSVNMPEIMFLTGLGVIVVLFLTWMSYVAWEKLKKRSMPNKVVPSGIPDRRQSVYETELS